MKYSTVTISETFNKASQWFDNPYHSAYRYVRLNAVNGSHKSKFGCAKVRFGKQADNPKGTMEQFIVADLQVDHTISDNLTWLQY